MKHLTVQELETLAQECRELNKHIYSHFSQLPYLTEKDSCCSPDYHYVRDFSCYERLGHMSPWFRDKFNSLPLETLTWQYMDPICQRFETSHESAFMLTHEHGLPRDLRRDLLAYKLEELDNVELVALRKRLKQEYQQSWDDIHEFLKPLSVRPYYEEDIFACFPSTTAHYIPKARMKSEGRSYTGKFTRTPTGKPMPLIYHFLQFPSWCRLYPTDIEAVLAVPYYAPYPAVYEQMYT